MNEPKAQVSFTDEICRRCCYCCCRNLLNSVGKGDSSFRFQKFFKRGTTIFFQCILKLHGKIY